LPVGQQDQRFADAGIIQQPARQQQPTAGVQFQLSGAPVKIAHELAVFLDEAIQAVELGGHAPPFGKGIQHQMLLEAPIDHQTALGFDGQLFSQRGRQRDSQLGIELAFEFAEEVRHSIPHTIA